MQTESWLIFLVVRAVRVGLLVYLGLLALLAGCQRRYIYLPQRLTPDQARQQAQRSGLEAWHDADGQFAAWRRPPPDGVDASGGRRRVLVFHGNAGNALHRTYYMDGFESAAPDAWDVILFEYPGYGARPGHPAETTITQAAAAALAALMAEDPAPVYLVGESLGSGPACRLAADYAEAVAGLWLVTPFTSLADAARVHYPVFPVRLLLRDRYDNLKALQRYVGRLVVLTAGRDMVVPERLGRRLYEGAASMHKRWIQQPDADHNTLDLGMQAGIWAAVAAFWTEAGEQTP